MPTPCPTAMSDALILYKNVEIHQQELCVLTGVDLELHGGEFVYFIGKVGSGKTSLLKTFYGELDVIAGQAGVLGYDMRRIKRKHIPRLRRRLGIIFQARIEEVLRLVGMENKGYKLPHELSGGEQQRIVIARAMLNSPEIILADEPTGNLDAETSHDIVRLLHDISREEGTLVVMTTHNLQLLHEFPGRVYRCQEHLLKEVTAEYAAPAGSGDGQI